MATSMTPQVFYIKQGTTLPAITATLIDQNGNVANLTGATVYFRMTNGIYGNVINTQATVTNATLGQVSYSWGSTDTNKCGTFSCEWYVVFSGGGQETYPQGFYNTVVIDPALNSGFVPLVAGSPLFNTIWSGSAAPTNTQGNNGDFWFNTTNLFFYGPKTNGTWPAGYLTSPAGAPLSSFGAPTANVNMGGFSFNNLDHINASPTATTTTALVANNALNTTVDVADFQVNGTTYWSVTSAGSLLGVGQLKLAPTSTSLTPLVVNIPTGATVDGADFQINGTTFWSFTNIGNLSGSGSLSVSPTSTSATAATFNTPSGSTGDVAHFNVNGSTKVSVNQSGNLQLYGQLDLSTANASNPIIGAASQTYAVSWTAATTNPSLGNGTLTGNYFKLGRYVWVNISLKFGSTTTAGTGTWYFTVPTTPVATNAGIYMGSGLIVVPATGTFFAPCQLNTSNNRVAGMVADTSSIGKWDSLDNTAYPWNSTTTITFTISYESTT